MQAYGSACILEHSGIFCMNSGTFCIHSWIFWNILEHSSCILEPSACILEPSGTFCMHSGTFCMYSRTFCMQFQTFCMHSGSFSMHSRTFCMHSGTICMNSGTFCMYSDQLSTHRQTHTRTDIRTCWAASSQPKTRGKNQRIVLPYIIMNWTTMKENTRFYQLLTCVSIPKVLMMYIFFYNLHSLHINIIV